MHKSPFLRVAGISRRSERGPGGTAAGSTRHDRRNRVPAAYGIDFSPVHGRHCICDRCLTQRGKQN